MRKVILILAMVLLSSLSFAVAENESVAVDQNATENVVAEEPQVTEETSQAAEAQPVAGNITEAGAPEPQLISEAPETNGTTADTLIDVNQTIEKEAGVTPDHTIRYGLKRAMERISELLTFSKSAKAKMGLAHARERLAEVQMMISQKKLDAAEKAVKAHEQELDRVKGDIAGLGDENETQAFENDITQQSAEVTGIKARLKSKVLSKLSDEQRTRISELITSLKTKNAEVKTKIKEKRDQIRGLKAEEQKTRGEVKQIKQEAKQNTTEVKQEIKEIVKEAKDNKKDVKENKTAEEDANETSESIAANETQETED